MHSSGLASIAKGFAGLTRGVLERQRGGGYGRGVSRL